MRTRWLFLLVLCLGLVSPAAVRAQRAAARLPAELDRTEQLIEHARSVLSAGASAGAADELQRAIDLQARARAAAERGRPRIALELTHRAQAAADRAIGNAGELPASDRVQGQLDRTRELLERGRPSIEACRDDSARELWSAADDMQRRAEEAGRGGKTLAALQLTMGARDRVQQALRQCNVQDRPGDEAERALRRTDDVIQQAQARLGTDAPELARALLARARDTQNHANRELKDQRFESSVRLTLSARMAAARAARMAGRSR